MRVLALIPGFPVRAEEWPPSQLLERLANRVELTVATWSHPDRPGLYWQRHVRVLPLRRLRRPSRGLGALLGRFDALHAFWALQPGALGAALALARGAPLVVSALGGEVADVPEVGFGSAGSLWHRALAGLALSRADAVVCGSRLQLEGCWRLARLRRAELLPIGVHERFQPRAFPSDASVELLSVGSLIPVKRPGLLLEAVARLPARFRLSLAGDGALRAELEARAARPDLAGRVRFLGQRSPEGVAEALGAAHVLVHTSAHESIPMVLLEALACARPVVSTRVGAAPEWLADGAGELAEPTPAALAEAIERVGAAPERYRAAATRAGERVRATASLEAVADALVRLYRDLSPGLSPVGEGSDVQG